jgi:homeobox protein cut-like
MGFESSLTAAHLHWSKINLSQLQKELDEQSLQVIQTQAQSFESRKILVEHTKELKKKEDPTIIDFKSLLKEYQAEIDLINKRSKNAETLFLGLYKVFAEVPDPCPVFESALQKSKQLQNLERIETNNEKLRDDLETAQLEITLLKENEQIINQLKLDLSNFENSLESRVSERVATATLELQADMDERHIIYKETENSLKKQLNHAKEQLTSLQNNQEFTQASIIINNEESSRSAEMEILTLDLENANSKREHILKENLLLKEQLRKVKDDSRYLELKKQYILID